MSSFIQHLRFGLRLIRKSPVFYSVVILVLALGIGANTAVFSVVDAVLLHKLPYRDPDRLVMVWEKNPTLGAVIGERIPTAYVNFQDWVRQQHVFDGIAGFEDVSLNRTGMGEPERIAGARVSPNFFSVLGVTPEVGSSFDFVEGDPSQSHAAILGYAYWKSHFGGSPGVLGQTLTLNDTSYIVVGVLPANFHLPSTREGTEQRKPDIWIPYEPATQRTEADLTRRKVQVFARLKDGVSLEQARREMDLVAKRLEEQNPALNAGFGGINIFPVYVEDVGKQLQRNLLALLGAVGLILLLACANLANLMLTRAMARQKELALRKALGASRSKLIVQMIVEGLLLSFFGSLLAIAVGYLGIQLLLALKPADLQRPEQVHLSIAVLLFTMAIGTLAGIVFAIIPAIYVSKTDVNAVLKESTPNQRHSGRVRAALVVGEVSLAVVLLIAAAFMIGSLISVLHVDPGFRADHVLTMHFSMPPSRYAKNEQLAHFCQQALERISALPGVKSASFSDGLPMTRIRMMKFTVDGQPTPPRGSEPTADMRGISAPSYFETLGIPIVAGRNFTVDEINQTQPVIVINQTLARHLWPGQDPVGRHLRTVAKPGAEPLDLTVIGIAGDTHQDTLETGTRPEVLRPMVDYTYLTLSVRTAADPGSLTSAIKRVVWTLDKDLPVYDIETMSEVVETNLGQRRFDSYLMGIFGGLALLLAGIGIYGVLSSTVQQRTPEIGIRMALGARRENVLRMVMGYGLKLVLIGMGIGLVAGLIVTRVLASLLFGVSVANPLMYLAVCVGLTLVAIAACYLPARAAIKVDPVRALRAQ
ncbi:MAG: ABC transporter permease [Candidatus Korobacteraceae bacterium]